MLPTPWVTAKRSSAANFGLSPRGERQLDDPGTPDPKTLSDGLQSDDEAACRPIYWGSWRSELALGAGCGPRCPRASYRHEHTGSPGKQSQGLGGGLGLPDLPRLGVPEPRFSSARR